MLKHNLNQGPVKCVRLYVDRKTTKELLLGKLTPMKVY